ncbi:Dabb family protein [Flagellimonas sp. W118]|uniref:Dabb family protein n=1 Tax=Flagellimonas sp. W118 TaxID=3410791 RepID=UPI003BF56926
MFPQIHMIRTLFLILLIFCSISTCQKTNEFHHILLYTWSENVGGQKKEAFLKIFEELPSAIEGLEKVRIAEIENSSGDYDFVIDLTFSSNRILKHYQSHPNHQKIEHLANEVIQDYSYFQYSMK